MKDFNQMCDVSVGLFASALCLVPLFLSPTAFHLSFTPQLFLFCPSLTLLTCSLLQYFLIKHNPPMEVLLINKGILV